MASDLELDFEMVTALAGADIRVNWTDGNNDGHPGMSLVSWNEKGEIVEVSIFLVLSAKDKLAELVTHELGHAVGFLGLSDSSYDVMYGYPSVDRPSTREDRALDVLYSLPPGSVKGARLN